MGELGAGPSFGAGEAGVDPATGLPVDGSRSGLRFIHESPGGSTIAGQVADATPPAGFGDEIAAAGDPLTSGVSEFDYAAPSAVSGGTPLFLVSTFTPFVAKEFVGSGLIVVSADTNIINPLSGSGGYSGGPLDDGQADNAAFFTNLLPPAGGIVHVLDNTTPLAGSTDNAANELVTFYNALAGTTSVLLSGNVTDLTNVDLFVAPLPDDDFTGPELTILGNFLTGGGTILFTAENTASPFITSTAAINNALSALISTLIVVAPSADPGFNRASLANGQIPLGFPSLISSAVDSSGAVGFNGTVRTQIEWDLSSITVTDPDEIHSAIVTLTTEIGAGSDVDTAFFVGTGVQDGLLSEDDFEAGAIPLPNVIMPVPAGSPGDEGTFIFDVTNGLKEAVKFSLGFLSIQGRVDNEAGLIGGGFREGLLIHSSAPQNLALGKEPQLEVVLNFEVSTGSTLSWAIRTLPACIGATIDPCFLTTTAGATVGVGTIFTEEPTLVFSSTASGSFSIGFDITEGAVVDSGNIIVEVLVGDECIINGRDPDCAPQQP